MSKHLAVLRLFAFLAVLFALMANSATMQAKPVDIASPFPFPKDVKETKGEWKITWAAPVKLQFDAADTTNKTVGTLIDISEISNADGTEIIFEQTVMLDDDSDPMEGLRVNFSTKNKDVKDVALKNKMTTAWSGYLLNLIEETPVFELPDHKYHPAWAHFHPKTATSWKPFVGYMPKAEHHISLSVGDGVNSVAAMTGVLEIQNLLIHEREFAKEKVKGGLRKFRLIQKPSTGP